jgi:hypothetical protein
MDYLAVTLLLLAPSFFDFAGAPASICYALALVQLGMSLVTAYPLGLAKLLPFTIHGGIELVASIFLVAAPWLFNFADDHAARNFFVIAGAGLLLLYAITDYKAADLHRRRTGLRQERVPSQT